VNFVRLLDVLGLPDLASDTRFADNAARMANLGALVDVLTARFKTLPSSDWLTALDRAGVPAGPVLSIAQMLEHPQVKARAMVIETQHPRAGATHAIGCPIKLSATPGAIGRPAPLFGQHTSEVLREFGFADSEIAGLLETGAAVQASDELPQRLQNTRSNSTSPS
jgi:crotonobetainyl-CoA:carnitine CoA-transferase CaiB-like acyl-CoA transferase